MYPTQSLQKGLRAFHFGVGGPAAARAELAQTLARSWSASPSKQGKARTAMQSFDNYVHMATTAGGVAISPIDYEVQLGPNSVNAKVDVALLEPYGYSGRMVLWTGVNTPDRALTRMVAFVGTVALQLELGSNRVIGLEVWHPRTRSIYSFDITEALGARASVLRALRRAAT